MVGIEAARDAPVRTGLARSVAMVLSEQMAPKEEKKTDNIQAGRSGRMILLVCMFKTVAGLGIIAVWWICDGFNFVCDRLWCCG